MSFDDTTLRLGDERDRLDGQLDDYAAQLQAADTADAIQRLAAECEQRLAGVSHLCDEFGADAVVTIRGLTAGEFAKVEDRVAEKRERSSQEQLPGFHRNVYVASGLVAAPFVDTDAGFNARLEAVAGQPVGVVKWLQERIDDATSVTGDDFRSLGARLAATGED